jgi:hypothetical protein
MSAGPVARLRGLGAARVRLLLRAAVLLGFASAAVAILPFRWAIRFGSAALNRGGCDAEMLVWAVEAAARRLPWRTVCIEKGLVVQRMLRSSGLEAILHYGARHNPQTGRLEAHVWVTVGGEMIIGGAEAADFAELATYPRNARD